MKILVTPTSMTSAESNPALKQLEEFADEVVYNRTGRPLDEDALAEALKDCDGYLAGLDYITEKALSSAGRLKVISRYGAGYDRVDLNAAGRRGITVTNTPGANAQAVGELSFAMMMNLARNLAYLDQNTKNGGWVRSNGIEIYGKTLGIVGFGAIGRVVAECGRGFHMRTLAYDPYIDENYCCRKGIECTDMETLIRESDFITLHVPLTESTYHMIDDRRFSMMKEGVILVNASRGGIVDEEAAAKALYCGRLGGLGLDAFEKEPPEKDSPLFKFDNVLVTPHTGAHTKEAALKMGQMAVDNLIHVLCGEDCPYTVCR